MNWVLLGSVLLMGFLGSWHCGVMCGPLSCNFRKQKDFFSYHLGRLVSYVIIGSLLFYGSHFFLNSESRTLKVGSSLFFGVVFILFGLSQLNFIKSKQVQLKYFKFQFKIIEKNKDIAKRFPIVLGLLTGLFPCMWLYSFLILSSQVKSIDQSLLIIFLFWLSSLPAFVLVASFMQGLIRSAPLPHQKISAIVLILAGLFSVVGQWAEIMFL